MYEETIVRCVRVVHQFGGQVYLDGANMSAQGRHYLTGLLWRGRFACRLHKTFCTFRTAAVAGRTDRREEAHLAPFVPGHGVVQIEGMY